MPRYPIATKSNNIDLVPAEKKPRVKRLTEIPLKYQHLTPENCTFKPMELDNKSGGPNLSESIFSEPNLTLEQIFRAIFDNWVLDRLVRYTNLHAARSRQKRAIEKPDYIQRP
jgi:hypothetical protein